MSLKISNILMPIIVIYVVLTMRSVNEITFWSVQLTHPVSDMTDFQNTKSVVS